MATEQLPPSARSNGHRIGPGAIAADLPVDPLARQDIGRDHSIPGGRGTSL